MPSAPAAESPQSAGRKGGRTSCPIRRSRSSPGAIRGADRTSTPPFRQTSRRHAGRRVPDAVTRNPSTTPCACGGVPGPTARAVPAGPTASPRRRARGTPAAASRTPQTPFPSPPPPRGGGSGQPGQIRHWPKTCRPIRRGRRLQRDRAHPRSRLRHPQPVGPTGPAGPAGRDPGPAGPQGPAGEPGQDGPACPSGTRRRPRAGTRTRSSAGETARPTPSPAARRVSACSPKASTPEEGTHNDALSHGHPAVTGGVSSCPGAVRAVCFGPIVPPRAPRTDRTARPLRGGARASGGSRGRRRAPSGA